MSTVSMKIWKIKTVALLRNVVFGTLLFGLSANIAFGAVTYDGSQYFNTATNSYTASGDILYVSVENSTTDDCTVEYDGVSLTKSGSSVYIATADAYISQHYLANPPAGSHTLAVTCTDFADTYAVSFTGGNSVESPSTNAGTPGDGLISDTYTISNDGSIAISASAGRFGPHELIPNAGITNDISNAGGQHGIGYSAVDIVDSPFTMTWENTTVSVETSMLGLVIVPCSGSCGGATSTTATTTIELQDIHYDLLWMLWFFVFACSFLWFERYYKT